ncbi:hypothetical protein [Streptomyces sp. SID3212]|uniref:hypothetical protein n=1 Tax=Streptomyces sp. SID3212 TaxID=2690259 RepID=UPI00136AA3A6|nr:hypothetical protein [Streptomyces sp. SID3212]MYV52211.1 hypothetical protein [Streptomyces sp. SID3212]
MMLEGSSPGAAPAAPTIEEVLSFAQNEVRTAAAGLWPTAAVEVVAHVPGVTGYVCRVRVGGRDLYAKYAYLGISLVSLSRGARGGWSCVRRAQRAYAARPDALLVREAAQLRFLAALDRPRVCAVAGLHPSGVLFTEPVAGPTLASLLRDRPQDTAALIESTWSELDHLHRPQTVRTLTPGDAIAERGIASTFRRKFEGVGGSFYLDRLGDERCSACAGYAVLPRPRDGPSWSMATSSPSMSSSRTDPRTGRCSSTPDYGGPPDRRPTRRS